jgi:hypothetical protein
VRRLERGPVGGLEAEPAKPAPPRLADDVLQERASHALAQEGVGGSHRLELGDAPAEGLQRRDAGQPPAATPGR